MVVDSGQGRIESVARRLLVGLAWRELAATLGGVLRFTDKEDPVLEDCRCEWWRNRVEIHEIHVIRFERVTEVGTQPQEHVVVAGIGWPVLVKFDCEIDIACCVGRFGGVRAEENREADRMLSEHSLEGVEIEGGIESDRLSSFHCQKPGPRVI